MRWSLRRGNRDADGSAMDDAPSAPVSGAPADSDPGWRAVPPLHSSWSAQPPLTSAPLTPRTPLTAESPRRAATRPLDGAPGEAPDPGRVIGLASARPVPVVPPLPVVPAGPPTPYVLDRPPLRHAPARPLVEHANLTEASDAYVGEPIAAAAAAPPPPAPAPPFGAPARPTRPEPPVEAATDAGARFREALANLHKSGLPRYESPSDSGGPPPPAPPPTAAGPDTAAPPGSAPLTHRRNTLAQSRRLGLGAPLRPEAGEDGDDEGGPDGGDPERAAPEPRPTPPAAQLAPPPSQPPTAYREAVQPAVAPVPPTADGSARPASSAAPLVFRSRPAGRVATEAATRPVPRAVVTRPPAELAQALRSSHGVDVADVPVHRDDAAANEARERRARAFSRGGRVFLPEEAGALSSAQARSLLAHELVHVAQQRRLGSSLPGEDTPEGQALEAEAQHAEKLYAAETFAEPELVHAPPPVSAGWVEERLTQHAFMTPPAGYAQALQGLGGDTVLNEVKYAATEVIKKAVEDGDLGGAGGAGGAGGRNPNLPMGVGAGNAQTREEFEAQALAAYNAQVPASQRVERFGELSPEQQSQIDRRYQELIDQNGEAILQSRMLLAVQQVASGQHENMTWTPQTGFQRTATPPGGTPGTTPGGAPGTTPSTTPSTTGGTTPSLTDGTTPPTTPGTTPSTTPGTAPSVARPGAAANPTGVDVGMGHARNWEEFKAQTLVVLNVDGDPNHPITWEHLSSSDQQRIEARWAEMSHAQEGQARATRIQNALRAYAQAHPAQTAATAGAPGTAAVGAAAVGAVAGAHAADAHAADARTAAEHTNNLETDSGITNTTASGHAAISVDRIDMDDLTVRVYERLRSRLRTELLIDRERAGLLTDFR